ncbi:metallophosphoesterase [Rothia sp. AR01]|uniref:Metallophosphoesterase n=1 Tax=Rothia santali TaxID=2949643 RepID=A0A9X2H838_9MICC|nr:metallophosphoesterase [Rothia santali]MCP3424814.1 metallophosphoesterase [Rothia santali]
MVEREHDSKAERIYAVSDIHGYPDALRAALDLVDLEGDPGARLVLLGDYVDRGPASAEVLEIVRRLQLEFPERVTALLGNHEEWLLEWLDGDDEDLGWIMSDADLVTVKSFLGPPEQARAFGDEDPGSDASALDGPTTNGNLKRAVRGKHAALISWLRGLPRLYETPEQIYVHAGVDEEAGDLWRAATPDHVLTEKYPPTFGPFVKTVVAGHVRTSEMHADGSHGVFHDGQSHYYIDGDVESTGQVNVLRYAVADGRYASFACGSGEEKPG